jgi:hypothetical protein
VLDLKVGAVPRANQCQGQGRLLGIVLHQR